jgi:hypothetical protein
MIALKVVEVTEEWRKLGLQNKMYHLPNVHTIMVTKSRSNCGGDIEYVMDLKLQPENRNKDIGVDWMVIFRAS